MVKFCVFDWVYGAVFGFEFCDDADDELLWVLHLGPLRVLCMQAEPKEDETSDD